MIRSLRLSEIAKRLGGELHFGDTSFSRVSTDTRGISQGDLFVALKGDRFDAHEFLAQAQRLGASALVVEVLDPSVQCPQLLVADTTLALGNIARLNRELFSGQVIALTGSCGKTTVKEMLSSIMSECGEVHATRGNLNNHIGVPQTLLELPSSAEFAVVEMGASGLGEIQYLAQITQPHVALVNNVAAAHLEGFGSEDGVASEKSSIYKELLEGGHAVVNLDDKYATGWLQQLASQRSDLNIISFSRQDSGADIFAGDIALAESGCYRFTLHCTGESAAVKLPLLGRVNISNALAAAACAMAAGASLLQVVEGLQKTKAVAGRMKPLQGINGSLLIDDSYNANPGSVMAAASVLCDLKQGRETILVLGDLAELGGDIPAALLQLGGDIQSQAVDQLITVGMNSEKISQGFRLQQGDAQSAHHFSKKDAAVDYLMKTITNKTVALVKGSRSARMEQVVQAITLGGEK